MSIKRNGSQASIKGPTENFTGNVSIDPLFQAPSPAVFGGASVTRAPLGTPTRAVEWLEKVTDEQYLAAASEPS